MAMCSLRCGGSSCQGCIISPRSPLGSMVLLTAQYSGISGSLASCLGGLG